ncbi:DNA repair protein rev1, partial [Plakobranchus ocellatus]
MDSSSKSLFNSKGEAKGQTKSGVSIDEGKGQTKRGRGIDDDGWGGFRDYMDAKKSKLDVQFDKDRKGKKSNIFAGIHIYVNGYT